MTKAVIPPCWPTQLATSSTFAIAFEELNDEGSHTTVFPAWNNVSAFLHDQTTQRQSIWEARIKMILLYHALYISEAGSVRASQWLRKEHAADMVSHVTGPGCLIDLKYHRKRTQHVSSPDWRVSRHVFGLSDRNMMNEARNRIHLKNDTY